MMCRGFSAIFTQRGSVCPWLCSVHRLRDIPGKKRIWPPSLQSIELLDRRLISASRSVCKLHNRDLEEMMRSSEALSKEEEEEEEEKFDADESFGLLTQKYPPKPFSRAPSADFHNLRLQIKEQEEDDDDEEELEIKPRRGPRNTPYWYFLQCKALIKKDKVITLALFF